MQSVVFILGGAGQAGAALTRFASSLTQLSPGRRGNYVVHVDLGPDRSARMVGAGFIDTTAFLPDGCKTVTAVFQYVKTAKLPNGIDVAADVLAEMADPEVLSFVQKNPDLPVDKGGFGLKKWVRILYAAIRPKLIPSRVEAWVGILRNEIPVVGSTGDFEVVIKAVFGGGGGAGTGLEKHLPEDEAFACKKAFERLQKQGEISMEAPAIVPQVVRIMVGFSSYLHRYDSDGSLLTITHDDIFDRCFATVRECTGEGRSLVVLSEEGSDPGPALFHLLEKAADLDRINLNLLPEDNHLLGAAFVSTRTVTASVLTRLTLKKKVVSTGGGTRPLLEWLPPEEAIPFLRKASPARPNVKEAPKFGSRAHLIKETEAVRAELSSLDAFARRHSLNPAQKEECGNVLRQYQARIDAVFQGLPNDVSGRLFIAPHEVSLAAAALDLPVVLPSNFLEELPTTMCEFGTGQGVFFSQHFTHDRFTEQNHEYVVYGLVERGPTDQLGTTRTASDDIWK